MMSDNILSQEEIEALLRGESIDTGGEAENGGQQEIRTEDYLDDMEQDALGEIGNISFGSSATALSGLLGQKVEITTPTISVIDRNDLDTEFVHPYVAVGVEYTAGLSGTNLLVIKQSDAAIIADLMLGGDGLSPDESLGEIHLSAVQEAMNQMMGSAATSMSTVFNKKVDISPPTIELLDVQADEGTDSIPNTNLLIRVSFNLKVGELIDSNIMQLFPLDLGKELVAALVGDPAAEAAPTVAEPERMRPQEQAAPAQEPPRQEPSYQQPVQPQYDHSQQQTSQPAYAEPQQQLPPRQQAHQQLDVQQAQFASFDAPSLSQSEASNLNLLLDIPLRVTVELGRTQRSVKEILEMSSGSIIELDKLAGEPVDILVNNRRIAKGEVVVIDENFGVRITDILSQTERLNNLR